MPKISARLSPRIRGALGTALSVVLLAASVLFLIGQSYNPFIYFRF